MTSSQKLIKYLLDFGLFTRKSNKYVKQTIVLI